MITESNITYHELIGLKAEVVDGNPSSIGIKGKIVDETMNRMEIEGAKGVKKVTKKNSKFVLALPSGKRVLVNGNVLIARPEDRIKKKVTKW